jgi:hypothetical protein
VILTTVSVAPVFVAAQRWAVGPVRASAVGLLSHVSRLPEERLVDDI